jgi:hypothetical protein
VCNIDLTCTLALNQRSKSSIRSPHTKNRSSHSGIAITNNLIKLVEPTSLFSQLNKRMLNRKAPNKEQQLLVIIIIGNDVD